jgi:tetratricopeptide (TPR) repeat protein
VARRLRPWARDGALLIALSSLLTSLDLHAGRIALWWTFPVALLVLALTLPVRALRWWHVGAVALVGGTLAVRAIGSLTGPLPAAGLREALDLAMIFVLALTLWIVARGEGLRATVLWSLALAIAWLSELLLLFAGAPPSPVARPTFGLAALGGGVIVGYAFSDLRRRAARPAWERLALRRRPPRWWAGWPLRAATLGLGFAWGVAHAAWPRALAQAELLALEAGRDAIQRLWLQSLLVGWGRHAIQPLGNVLAEPHQASFYPWSGVWGLLAVGGLIGLGMMVALCLALVLRRRVVAEALDSPRFVPPGAMAMGLLLGGMILGGGPLSASLLMIFAGWLALALARPASATGHRVPWSLQTTLATATLGASLVLLTLLTSLPLRGDRLARMAESPALTIDQRLALLARARSLNPFSPAIPLRQAVLTRQRMTLTPGWSESLYQSVVECYGAAQRLDPYNSLSALQLATFQNLCDRPSEAQATVQAALDRRPHDEELAEWLFLASQNSADPRQSFRLLGQGLLTDPTQARWWLRMFALTNRRGQSLLARKALDVALTAEPDNPRLREQAWQFDQTHAGSEGPGVQMPLEGIAGDQSPPPVEMIDLTPRRMFEEFRLQREGEGPIDLTPRPLIEPESQNRPTR